MFGEGRLGPGGPVTRHGARSPLPGVGDVPGTGPAGCPGSQTGVGASSKTGHGRRRGLLPRRQRGGRGREELPWPPSLWPQRPWDCWPDAAPLHGSFPVQDGSLGESTRTDPGESIPAMLGCPPPPVRWDISSTGTRQEPYQETRAALSLLAQGGILDEPWAHPAFCTHGRSTATTAGGVRPCPAPKTLPLAHPHLLVLHVKPLSPRGNAI